MNKTINISLNGVHFNIDDNAYTKLEEYLKQIRLSLLNDEGKEEIMVDVETRIAELFQQYLGIGRDVVNVSDVDHIIATMGKPEQFFEEEIEANEKRVNDANYSQQYTGIKPPKKLFRDPDEKILGGVLAGLAHYIGLKTTWVRVIYLTPFLLDIFTFIPITTSFLVFIYIFLWVIIPSAKTNVEKLQMYGEPVNLDSIKKNINKEEINETVNNVASNARQVGNDIGSFIEKLLRVFLKLGRIILGLLFTFYGFALFVCAIVFIFVSILKKYNFLSFGNMILDEPWQYTLAVILIIFLLLSVSFLLLYVGIRLITNGKSLKNSTNFLIASISIAIISLIGLVIMGFSTAVNFMEEINYPVKQEVAVSSDTLQFNFNTNSDIVYFNNHNFPGMVGRTKDLDSLVFKIDQDIELKLSSDSHYYLETIYTAFGKDGKEARYNMEKIKVNYTVDKNTLNMNKYFSLPSNGKFRNQHVKIAIYVPKGKYIRFNNVENIHSDNYNYYYNIWESNLTKQSSLLYLVDESGPHCKNCITPEEEQEISNPDNLEMNLNSDSVPVEGSVEIKSDSSQTQKGVKINVNLKETQKTK